MFKTARKIILKRGFSRSIFSDNLQNVYRRNFFQSRRKYMSSELFTVCQRILCLFSRMTLDLSMRAQLALVGVILLDLPPLSISFLSLSVIV